MFFIKVISVLQFFTRFAGGNHGNFFKLSNGDNENGRGNQPSLTNFHRCSLNNDCTDVAENKVSGELKQIAGSEEKEKASKDNNLLWTKIPGLKYLYFSCLKLCTVLPKG